MLKSSRNKPLRAEKPISQLTENETRSQLQTKQGLLSQRLVLSQFLSQEATMTVHHIAKAFVIALPPDLSSHPHPTDPQTP